MRTAKNTPVAAPESSGSASTPARVEPAPAPAAASQVMASNNANYQAVEACRDRLFLGKELCLSEHCNKPGARNHPLCVKWRDEARMREDSKGLRGPQTP